MIPLGVPTAALAALEVLDAKARMSLAVLTEFAVTVVMDLDATASADVGEILEESASVRCETRL